MITLDRGKIFLIMARQCFTFGDVAKAYGVTRERIRVILYSATVSLKTAYKLADALGVDITEITSTE